MRFKAIPSLLETRSPWQQYRSYSVNEFNVERKIVLHISVITNMYESVYMSIIELAR